MYRHADITCKSLIPKPFKVLSWHYLAYHDEEWGKPERDKYKLFEMICLEGQQAGLSWYTVQSNSLSIVINSIKGLFFWSRENCPHSLLYIFWNDLPWRSTSWSILVYRAEEKRRFSSLLFWSFYWCSHSRLGDKNKREYGHLPYQRLA